MSNLVVSTCGTSILTNGADKTLRSRLTDTADSRVCATATACVVRRVFACTKTAGACITFEAEPRGESDHVSV